MSLFNFPTVEANSRMDYGKVNIPFTDWTSFRFGESVDQTFGFRLWDTIKEKADSSAYLDPIKANQLYGVDDLDGLPGSGLKFDFPVREETAKGRQVRKFVELEDMNVRELAAHSAFSAKAVGSFIFGALPGSMAHPLDFAVNLVPFVGPEAKALAAARITGKATSVFEHGLFGAERAMNPYLTSAINGTLGNAIVEIPVAIQNFSDQRMYSVGDAGLNIAMGGVGGAALHGLGVGLERAAKIIGGMSDAAKTRAAKTFLADVLQGGDGDASRVVAVDIDANRSGKMFDEVAAYEGAILEVGRQAPENAKTLAMIKASNLNRANADELLKLLTITASSSSRAVDKTIAAKLLSRFKDGDRSVTLFTQAAELLEVRYDPTVKSVDPKGDVAAFVAPIGNEKVVASREAKALRKQMYDVENTLKEVLDRSGKETDPLVQRQLRGNADRLESELNDLVLRHEELTKKAEQPSSGLTPDESATHAAEMEARGDVIGEAEIRDANAAMQRPLEREHAERVSAAVEAQRKAYDAPARELERKNKLVRERLEAGKVVSEKEMESYGAKERAEEKDVADMEADAAELEKSLFKDSAEATSTPATQPAANSMTFQERFPIGEKVKYRPAGSYLASTIAEGTVIGHKKDPVTGDMFAEVQSNGGVKDYAGYNNDIAPTTPTAKPPEVGVSAKPAELKQWEKDVLEASHSDAMKAANDNDIKTAVDCIIANGLHLD